MEIHKVTKEYLDAAVCLAQREYEKECSFIPELYSKDYSSKICEYLTPIFLRGDGMMCVENGKLLGYLVQGFEWNNHGTRMIYSPVLCYAVKDNTSRKKIMSFLFQKYAKERIGKEHVRFEMSVYAHDREIMEFYVLTQFGIECTEAMRYTKEPVKEMTASVPNEITYCELSKETIQHNLVEILELYHRLVQHLQESPVFYPGTEFTDEMYMEFIMDKNTHLYGAYDQKELIGIIDCNYDEHSFITKESDTMNVRDIYIKEKYRGKQIAAGLLSYVNEVMAKQEKKRLWVMHGTANPNGRAFWDTYFHSFTYTLIRDILPIDN